MACAPMPSPRYSPKPYSEAKRSLSSRASFSSGTTCLGAIALELLPRAVEQLDPLVVELVDVLLALLDVEHHLADLERPGLDLPVLVARHLAVALEAQVVGQAAEVVVLLAAVLGALAHDVGQQAVAERAGLVELLGGALAAMAALSSSSSSAPSSPARNLIALSKRVRARPFSAPLPPSAESSVLDSAASASPATAATSSRSFGPSRRSSRTARLCMSSRTFLASVASIFEATSRSRPFAMSRAATRSKPSFSAHRLSMRAQYSSSSSNSSSDADTKYARRRTSRSATRSTSSVRSASSCSRSARIRPSRSARSASRFSWSTRVQMCAAK